MLSNNVRTFSWALTVLTKFIHKIWKRKRPFPIIFDPASRASFILRTSWEARSSGPLCCSGIIGFHSVGVPNNENSCSWDTNMAAMTSRENQEFTVWRPNVWPLLMYSHGLESHGGHLEKNYSLSPLTSLWRVFKGGQNNWFYSPGVYFGCFWEPLLWKQKRLEARQKSQKWSGLGKGK
jgi:hypothetical protein